MLAALLTGQEEEAPASVQTRSVAELLQPDLLVDGHLPEQRVVHHGLSWARYLDLDKLRGKDRSAPRFYYCGGQLEIMSVSDEHERIKKYLGDFLGDYFVEARIRVVPRGEATVQSASGQAGAEPDESWCLDRPKETPDLVLEVALSSGGIEKLALYRRLAVPEVWFWRGGRLLVHALRADGSDYEPVQNGSRLLPELDISLLERCVAMTDWNEARLAFRAGLAAKRAA